MKKLKGSAEKRRYKEKANGVFKLKFTITKMKKING